MNLTAVINAHGFFFKSIEATLSRQTFQIHTNYVTFDRISAYIIVTLAMVIPEGVVKISNAAIGL